MPKKIIIERKFRKTKQRIFIITLVLAIINGILLIFTLFRFFHQTPIISPVPILSAISKKILADPEEALNQTKTLLGRYNIPFENVAQDSDTIKIQLTDTEEADISANKNLEHQIASLQLTINHFTIEGKEFKKLDFRFDKPIVVFK